MKNRLSRHEFNNNNHSTTTTPQKTPVVAVAPKNSSTMMSTKGRLLQQLLLEKEQQLQGQGQIQQQLEASQFVRFVHHPSSSMKINNNVQNSNNIKTKTPTTAEQKFSVTTGGQD